MSSSKSVPVDQRCQRAIHENGVRHILAQVTPSSPRFLLKEARLEQVDDAQVLVLRLAITSPPEDGRANREVAARLAQLCGVPPKTLSLQSGHQSRSKRFFLSL